ncbi:MAG: UpxY family transcription antiterminator [Bacteroidales bacterium]|nr:UpxY family transcription antiterminator [Bacteroidales bacterium]
MCVKEEEVRHSGWSWFALRVTYGRALKFKATLDEAGFETFVPMCRRTVVKDGRSRRVLVPAVTNLCFVRSTKKRIDTFMKDCGEGCPARFMWDKATRLPVIVPDKPMEDFMKISNTMADDVIYLKEISAKLREGQKVRVMQGPFAGVEGTIIRVRRSRRVMVELPGMLAIATTYVRLDELEIIG